MDDVGLLGPFDLAAEHRAEDGDAVARESDVEEPVRVVLAVVDESGIRRRELEVVVEGETRR